MRVPFRMVNKLILIPVQINGTPSLKLGLDEVYKSFLGSDGKKIRLELLREDNRIRASFRLEKYI